MSPMSITVLTIIFFFSLRKVSSTRSPHGLALLAELELDIYTILVNPYEHLKLEEMSRTVIFQFLLDYEESALNVTKMFGLNNEEGYGVAITNNPLMSYRMTRRFALMLSPNHQNLRRILNPVLRNKWSEIPFWKWPSIPDLQDAMEALLRIYHVYNMDLKEFTSGSILGVQYPIELSGRQCFEIGEFAIELKQYSSAIRWLEIALNKTPKSDNRLSKTILKSLEVAFETHNKKWNTKSKVDYYFFHAKLNETNATGQISYRESLSMLQDDTVRLIQDDEVKFWELCSGRNFQSPQKLARLYCWYETHQNKGFWTISPLKMEQISISPYVMQTYDVLNDKFINKMKRQAIPRLSISNRFSEGNPNAIDQDSLKGFIPPSDETRKLAQITGSITGFSILPKGNFGENVSVTAYSYGGVDGGHLDLMKVNKWLPSNRQGDRIATVLVYLNKPIIGGQTGFPRIGVTVNPAKGSILMYYNLLKNGDPDPRMYHGGCPVVMGQKWILIQNIREHPQIFTRPCSLKPNE